MMQRLRTAWRVAKHPMARYAPYLVVTVAFVVSRLVYRRVFGVTFDTSPFGYFIQYIPLWILEHDFWRSILYLHEQAPLQNLVVGGAWVTLGATRAEALLDALYVTLGYVFAVSLLASMRRLGAASWIATIAVSLFIASPVAVIYETWLFYHLPVVTCFSLALFGLLRFYERPTFRAGLFFFSMLAIAALLRSIYGPIWMLAITVALLLRPPAPEKVGGARSPRRTLLLAALLPTLVVTLDVARVPLCMGRSLGSAMAWANLPLKIWPYLSVSERERLKSAHLVSDAVDHEAFTPLAERELRVPYQKTGVPLLDMEITPDGQVNAQALEYALVVDAHYKPDAVYLLKNDRSAYIDSVIDGFKDWYCSSPTRDIILYRAGNTRRLARVINALEGKDSRSQSLTALQIGLPLTFLYAVYRVIRPRGRAASERARTAAILFMLVCIVYEGVGTTLISYGDFSRYRYEVDSYYVALFALLATDVSRALARVAARAVSITQSGGLLIRRLVTFDSTRRARGAS